MKNYDGMNKLVCILYNVRIHNISTIQLEIQFSTGMTFTAYTMITFDEDYNEVVVSFALQLEAY